MPDTFIPASPSSKDYTEAGDYQDKMARNSEPIFERDDPFALFAEWMEDARAQELNDSNAMSLATVDASGFPDVRIVLLKGFDERGFVFYTNSRSVKGQQLLSSQSAALCFHWKSLRRQVRARGLTQRVSDEEADSYFAMRARGSQIGAWASDQSSPVESRAELEAAVSAAEARFDGMDVPRPPHWYGWRVRPSTIEFWRDRPFRLHDRLVFSREGLESTWTKNRLCP